MANLRSLQLSTDGYGRRVLSGPPETFVRSLDEIH
jgi:hypothetical protein